MSLFDLFTNHRAELAAARARIVQLEDSLAQAEGQLGQSTQMRDDLQEELSRMTKRLELSDGLFRNFGYFGESLAQLQHTLAHMAEALRNEKVTAIEAADASIKAREGTGRMTGNLHQVISTARNAAGHVDNLNARASAIGNIVNLINEISDQ
ncbi:MAG TPA: hypothetical protein VIR60_05240, partial [Gammaproteobacteria bacterium]